MALYGTFKDGTLCYDLGKDNKKAEQIFEELYKELEKQGFKVGILGQVYQTDGHSFSEKKVAQFLLSENLLFILGADRSENKKTVDKLKSICDLVR